MMALSGATQAISAKARAMYGRCLTPKDYRELLNCHSVGEAAAYLKAHTHYAEVLAGVNESTVHRGYLESAIRRKLFDDYQTLMYYDRSMNQRLSDYYFRKSEIDLIVRGLLLMRAGRTDDLLFSIPAYLSGHTRLDLKGMREAHSFEDLTASTRGTPYHAILQSFLPAQAGKPTLTQVENALYAYLYRDLFATMEALPEKERREIRHLFGSRVDSLQVTRICRMKRYFGMSPEEIAQNLLPVTGRLSKKVLKQMVEAETADRVAELFFATAGKEWGDPGAGDMDDLPMRLPYKVARRYMHFSTYPLVVFASYIMITEMEQDDLINIVEGIRYHLPSSDVESMLACGVG